MTATGPAAPHATLLEPLREKARLLRIHSMRMTTAAGSGHPTSCLSAAELMAATFFHAMKFDVADPNLQGFDGVGDPNQLPSLLRAFTKIFHARGNLLLVEDRLERLLDLIGERSGKWHFSLEKRNSAL